MSLSYYNLLLSAVNNATRGMPPAESAAIDAIGLADTLFPVVSQAVSEAAAADEYKRSLLTRTKTVTLSAGTATLTDDVLTRFMPDAVFYDPAALTKKYSWRPYQDFIRKSDPRVGVFSLSGGVTLVVREPGQQFVSPLTASGDRTLVIPSVVVKPATATTAVDCPDEILSDLDEALSEALRGQLAKLAGAAA